MEKSNNLVQVKGLRKEGVRVHPRSDLGKTQSRRHHNDTVGSSPSLLGQPFQYLLPRHGIHHQIEKDDFWLLCFQHLQGTQTAVCSDGCVAFQVKSIGDDVGDIWFIINNEDVHRLFPPVESGRDCAEHIQCWTFLKGCPARSVITTFVCRGEQ